VKTWGVYYYKGAPSSKAQVNAMNLWHQRNGHPSSQTLSYLSHSLNKSFPTHVKNEAYDVCFRDKQTRMHFPLSTNKALNCFELIHCDIWGPYLIASLCGAHYFFNIVNDASRPI